MLHVVPIEPLEERYSAQWLEWTRKYLNERIGEHRYFEVLPKMPDYKVIEHGAFLDVVKTNVFKNEQLRILLKLFENGHVFKGDVFWFHDLWFPGLEMLFYIRNALNAHFKIYGCLHAGTYDPYDFLSQKGMKRWGECMERGWFNEVDGIFVATKYHKKLLLERRKDPTKIHITGFPIYADEETENKSTPNILENVETVERKTHIVFPHRLDNEKNPQRFDELKKLFFETYPPLTDKVLFTKTKETCKTKDSYYETLDNSDIAISFADQETWGIAMQEAVLHGCIPLVPNRLSYTEMYDNEFFIEDSKLETVVEKIMQIISQRGRSYVTPWLNVRNRILDNGAAAFDNMLAKMGICNEI